VKGEGGGKGCLTQAASIFGGPSGRQDVVGPAPVVAQYLCGIPVKRSSTWTYVQTYVINIVVYTYITFDFFVVDKCSIYAMVSYIMGVIRAAPVVTQLLRGILIESVLCYICMFSINIM